MKIYRIHLKPSKAIESAFDFCQSKSIIAIGWYGVENDDKDLKKAKNCLDGMESGDFCWIKNEDEEYYICQITDSKTFNFKERFGEEKSKSLDLTYYKRCRWVLVSLNEDDKSLINVHLRTQFTLQPINNNPETKFTFEIFERSN